MTASAAIATLLAEATQRIAAALALDKREARIEARVLLSHALEVDHAWLIAHDRDVPTVTQQNAIAELIDRRAGGEPVAYILGEREFYGFNFAITPAVLIPRPDSELLVEAAFNLLPENTACRVLDLGTGSGAIAISLALHRPLAEVIALDISADALAVAQHNARRLGAGNVHFEIGDWFAAKSLKTSVKNLDIIVTNPPYIQATDPHLNMGDLRFEPVQALAAGDDGLRDLRAIIAGAPAHLVEGGWLLLEHGYDQAAGVTTLLQQHGFAAIRTLQDLAGLDRVSAGRWPGQAG
jgi:release factor glutamine methyltransferase